MNNQVILRYPINKRNCRVHPSAMGPVTRSNDMAKVLVLYYSSYGHIEQLAQAEAEGARRAGAEVAIRRVPETVPADVAKQAHFKLDQEAPIASVAELPEYDAVIFGTPTRFGNVAAQMRSFLDQTGGLFAAAKLAGRVGSVFTSSGQQHWGQETTIKSFHNLLFHHGFVVLGVPPTTPGLHVIDEVSGGSPYGASTIAGADGSRQPSANELEIARAQGEYVARIAAKLAAAEPAAAGVATRADEAAEVAA
jgi:NAD(P)H dehydrogenase (quinone)